MSLRNIWYLIIKEIKSVSSDLILMALVGVVFTVAVYSVSKGVTTEVKNASIAVIDNDNSTLSYKIRDSFLYPYFKPAQVISYSERDSLMDQGKFVFVIDIPPDFQKDLLAGKKPQIQLLVDATAATLAGVGSIYVQKIITKEVLDFLNVDYSVTNPFFELVINSLFNQNQDTLWFIGVTQVVANVTLLVMILVGAAIIREREHGTIEHLLVMPVKASEIALSKIVTNGGIIAIASLLSMYFVVHLLLKIPINGSVPLYILGLIIYIYTIASLALWLSTLAPTMPQFGLLCIPIYIVSRLLSGLETPLDSMDPIIQKLTYLSPVTQFSIFSQAVLFRDAGFEIIWPQLVILFITGSLFFVFALSKFRSMLARQG
ncbi:ABC transporter permease [Taylorella equigenitalis]|uniref:ABC transporter permease n=1 Tax=Taylorella equigenitalis TaxID=29575 RepID=UPI0003F527EA|nr:ABC transporter permease [Taylorella equigenitalis]ASY30471.1 hypothetical protein B9Z30_03655 [Taylorella equigenitalis]ASY37778.1 ABC transporter permease [Taylorella equigenitalis]ASY39246.1 ABC transporter permease [Taylorella equigenitalis]ASY40764.1 hypothetical protein CAV20_03590 [Taylorella equigenitalis]ASY42199.1 hypothetical protein CA943_03590 [Taylorella equigenitalis]